MKLKIDKNDCLKTEIKIPDGYRIIEDYELLKELRTNEKLIKIAKEGWIWVNTMKGIRAAGLYYGLGAFHVNGNISINVSGRSRGVFVKK